MGDIKLKNLNKRFRDGSILVRASRVWEFRGGTDEGDLQHIDIVFIDSEVCKKFVCLLLFILMSI